MTFFRTNPRTTFPCIIVGKLESLTQSQVRNQVYRKYHKLRRND